MPDEPELRTSSENVILHDAYNWTLQHCTPRTVDIMKAKHISTTYDHILQRTRDPVRSPISKLLIGGLVVRWVTTGEYTLLYVFAHFLVAGRANFFRA